MMYIYMIQSYDSYCSHFNPYVVAFKKEEDAEKQIELYNSIGDGSIKYGYRKVWLNETISKEQDSVIEGQEHLGEDLRLKKVFTRLAKMMEHYEVPVEMGKIIIKEAGR